MVSKLLLKILKLWVICFCISIFFLEEKTIIYVFYISLVLIPLILCWIIYSYIFLPTLIRKKVDSIDIRKNNIDFYLLETQDFSEILIFSQEIYVLLRGIYRLKKFQYITFWATKGDLEMYWNTELHWILYALNNLRSDLRLRLKEQQNSVEDAKSEVEKNIVWSRELDSVSQLQQSRLDRQIEQFEELQRVLVKV